VGTYARQNPTHLIPTSAKMVDLSIRCCHFTRHELLFTHVHVVSMAFRALRMLDAWGREEARQIRNGFCGFDFHHLRVISTTPTTITSTTSECARVLQPSLRRSSPSRYGSIKEQGTRVGAAATTPIHLTRGSRACTAGMSRYYNTYTL
jgi:hypothetical protein